MSICSSRIDLGWPKYFVFPFPIHAALTLSIYSCFLPTFCGWQGFYYFLFTRWHHSKWRKRSRQISWYYEFQYSPLGSTLYVLPSLSAVASWIQIIAIKFSFDIGFRQFMGVIYTIHHVICIYDIHRKCWWPKVVWSETVFYLALGTKVGEIWINIRIFMMRLKIVTRCRSFRSSLSGARTKV